MKDYSKRFFENISDDLNSPDALAVVWELLRDPSIESGDKLATILKFDKVLGLRLGEEELLTVPDQVVALAEERKSAREIKDFEKSDELRGKISDLGFIVEDLRDNSYKLTKK